MTKNCSYLVALAFSWPDVKPAITFGQNDRHDSYIFCDFILGGARK